MAAGNHTFLGINEIEAQDRVNEARTGVPALGSGLLLLLHASIKGTAGVSAVNVGEHPAHVRLRHQGQTKTATGEYLAALATGTNRFVGVLAHRDITPGTLVITNAGAPATVVDNGAGGLVDIGTTTARGTIDYANGLLALQYGAAVTEPTQAAYSHQDYTDFVSPAQATVHTPAGATGTGGVSELIQLGFGRVVPGSVSFSTNGGALTFVDDGKGNIIETTATATLAGSIDYATGLIDINTASIALTAVAATIAYTFNPFGARIVPGAAAKMLDTYASSLPELTAQPWAAGLKGESRVGLVGEAVEAGSNGTSLVTQWSHYGEEPYRVEEAYSGFPPGGVVAGSGLPNG